MERGIDRFGLFDPLYRLAHIGPISTEPVADDLERQEVFALLAQDPAQSLDVGLIKLAVARGRTLRIDQTLALQESNFGDCHIGKLLAEKREDITNRQITTTAHSSPATRYTSLNFPICTSSPVFSSTSSMRSRLT